MDKSGSANNNRKANKIILGIFAAIVLIVVIAAAAGGNKADKKATADKAAYSARIVSSDAASGSDLHVTFAVKNTGKTVGTPTCDIQASDSTDAYTGSNPGGVYPKDPIQPGATWNGGIELTITKQGAAYAKNVTINCK